MIIHRQIPKTYTKFITSEIGDDDALNKYYRVILEILTEDPRLEKRAERKWKEIYALWNSLWERDGKCGYEFEYKVQHILGKQGFEKSWKRHAIGALNWAEERRSILNEEREGT